MLNIGTVDVTGLDTKAEAAYAVGTWQFDATARYSFQRALDHSQAGSQTYGNQIPYIPLHSGGLSLLARWKRWSLGWDSTLTGGKWSRTANTPDYYIEPWSISDASLCRTIPLSGFKRRVRVPELKLALALNNLFNRHYQIVQGYPMPGFNTLLSLEFNW